LRFDTSAATTNSLADAFYSFGNYDSAIVYYKKAIALDASHSNFYVNLGSSLYYLQKYAESVPYFEKALAMDTSYIFAYPRLAYGYMITKKYNEAVNLYNKILSRDTTDQSTYYYNIACAKSILGKPGEAITALEKSFKTRYLDLAHINEDSDLDSIRSLPQFKKVIETYFKKEDIEKFPALFNKR
jgi:tetratricopeptide (TPR) repeat protein